MFVSECRGRGAEGARADVWLVKPLARTSRPGGGKMLPGWICESVRFGSLLYYRALPSTIEYYRVLYSTVEYYIVI